MDHEKKREADRQRKSERREKQKSMKENTYFAEPLERAKNLLEQMEEPDINAAFNDSEIGNMLKPDDRKVLSNFVYHLKSRRRK
jgi:hypothetical protein